MNNKHNGRDSHASSQCLKLSSCCWVCSHSSSCSSDTAALSACDHLLATGSGQDGYKNWLWFHKCIQCYYMCSMLVVLVEVICLGNICST